MSVLLSVNAISLTKTIVFFTRRLNRKNYRGGRATPDVGQATSEDSHHPHQQQQQQLHQQSEGTRLGLGSSQRGSVGSHSNLSYSNSTYSHSNHSHSNLSHSNLSANQSQAGPSQSQASGGSGNGQVQYTTSFANFSANATQGGANGLNGASLFELAAAQASLSGVGANKSTASSRAHINGSKTTAGEVKTEKGAARSQGESTAASTSGSGGATGMEEDGQESRGEEEDGDDNSSNHHSQQSGECHSSLVTYLMKNDLPMLLEFYLFIISL